MAVPVTVTKLDGTEIIVDLDVANTMRTAGELQTEERDGSELSQQDIMGADYTGDMELSSGSM